MRNFLIDTDTGSDDAVALAMALNNSNINIEAITVVAGNIPVEKGLQNALYTVDLCNKKTPVYLGEDKPLKRPLRTSEFFHGQDGLGDIGLDLKGRKATDGNAIDIIIKKVYEFLKKLCNQTYQNPEIVTNATKFYKHDYNDYENCNWWPHRDDGYNAIVYFNDECGTNLYAPDQENELSHEHHEPWIKKGKYQALKTIEPKFNKLVFFDGLKFPHGMDISNDTYFSKFRYNQVFFFDA